MKQHHHPETGLPISQTYFSRLLRASGGGRENHTKSYWDSVDWYKSNRVLAKEAGLKKAQTVALHRAKRGLPPDTTASGRPKKS